MGRATVPCKEYTYKCRSGRCISKQNPECDGEQDCEDHSDEDNCSECLRNGGDMHGILGWTSQRNTPVWQREPQSVSVQELDLEISKPRSLVVYGVSVLFRRA